MASPKDVLVVTTPSIEGAKIKKYLKPVSAHIVTGTNLFSDFLGGISDIFGGRSEAYQKQLSSIYNEAIERIKNAAFEIGGNCILGLSIDMDEISGKGKSMFMLTAIGTVVILEKGNIESKPINLEDEKFENVAVDKIHCLRNKHAILKKADEGRLILNEDVWQFLISNQVDEVLPTLLDKFIDAIALDKVHNGTAAAFHKNLMSYMEALPDDKKIKLLYHSLQTAKTEELASRLSTIIKDLNLFDYNLSMGLLENDDFDVKKRALRIVTYDKPFFNAKDKQDLQSVRDYIQNAFPERGKRTIKKQLLGKEKEVWLCECRNINDVGTFCGGCNKDIYGFTQDEYKPADVDEYIKQKIELINEFLE